MSKKVIDATAEVKSSEVVNPAIGERLMLTFDAVKPFTQKQEDGTEVKLQRVYHFCIPYLSPFEEIYKVIEEFKEELNKQEKITKENAAKLQAENELKEKQLDASEASHN